MVAYKKGFRGEWGMTDQWHFLRDEDGHWHWRYTSADRKNLVGSTRGFLSRTCCVADAISHGFSLWTDAGVTDEPQAAPPQ